MAKYVINPHTSLVEMQRNQFADDELLYFGSDKDYDVSFETDDGDGERLLVTGPNDGRFHVSELNMHIERTLDSGLASDTDYSDTALWVEANTSGSDSQRRQGLLVDLQAGYTGSGFTGALAFDNQVAGTNTDYTLDTSLFGYRVSGNRGIGGYSRATTTGHNVGGLMLAGGGAVNYGAWCASTLNKTDGTNVGVAGFANNQAGGTIARIGGYFAIHNDSAAPDVTGQSALIADNYSAGAHIIVGRHNNVDVFRVDSLGKTYMMEGQRVNVTEITDSTYQVLGTDYHISVQYTDTGTATITLPNLTPSTHGQVYHIKDADYNASVNNITVDTLDSATIDEEVDQAIKTNGACMTVIGNDTTNNWEIQ